MAPSLKPIGTRITPSPEDEDGIATATVSSVASSSFAVLRISVVVVEVRPRSVKATVCKVLPQGATTEDKGHRQVFTNHRGTAWLQCKLPCRVGSPLDCRIVQCGQGNGDDIAATRGKVCQENPDGDDLVSELSTEGSPWVLEQWLIQPCSPPSPWCEASAGHGFISPPVNAVHWVDMDGIGGAQETVRGTGDSPGVLV